MKLSELIKKIPIFSRYNSYTIQEFEKILKCTHQEVLNDIEEINTFFKEYELPLIVVENKRVYIPKVQDSIVVSTIQKRVYDYTFQEERLFVILLYIMTNNDFVSNMHLQQLLKMSKNSILSDLKKLKQTIQKWHVTLHYTRQDGYYVNGSPQHIRQLLEATIGSLLVLDTGKWMIQYIALENHIELEVDSFIDFFVETAKLTNCYLISEKMKETCYLFSFLNHIQFTSYVVYPKSIMQNLENSLAMQLVDRIIIKYPNLLFEREFILGRVLGCMQFNEELFANIPIYKIMNKIIDLVKANTGVLFSDTYKFRKNFYNHLLPAYYRLVFDNYLKNPLKRHIMREYSLLFYFVKRSLAPLGEFVGKVINDDEVSYFTIHFGGYLKIKTREEKRNYVALSVCPNGVSSSLLLLAELKTLMPEIIFKEVNQLEKVKDYTCIDYDMVFSTIFFESTKPVYVVQPLMNSIEKMILKRRVYDDFQIHQSNFVKIDDILAIVEKYATIKQKQYLEEELANYFVSSQKLVRNTEGLQLIDLLTIDLIQREKSVLNWQHAITTAAKPLLENGYIEQTYIDGMIDSINKLGSYVVLAPKVAVPHASFELGVKRLGISLLQLEEAVDFNLSDEEYDDDKKVQLLFVLAAVDSTSHLKALQQLAMILDDEYNIEHLISAKTEQDMLSIIEEIIKGEGE